MDETGQLATGENRMPAPDRGLLVEGLSVDAATPFGTHRVVDRVSLHVRPGTITALVGESGSGKSVTSLSAMRLNDPRILTIVEGDVNVDGSDIMSLSAAALGRFRGSRISMVFQDPMNSLDPSYTVGFSIIEVIRSHTRMSRRDANAIAIAAFEKVGIPNPELRMQQYPHQLSGGLLQRVMIAMAIVLEPKVLIADEPTTALDVVVQAQIMELLRSLADSGVSVLLVTHDLGVVAKYANRVYIMYAGQVVESGDVSTVLESPQHPYTSSLIGAVPRIEERSERLTTIAGVVPQPHEFRQGCRFLDRCPFSQDRCASPVDLTEAMVGQDVRCVRHPELDLEGV